MSAAEIFLTTNTATGGIDIERGATLSTIGRGRVPYDSRDGYTYGAGTASLLAISNGWLDVLPPTADQGANASAVRSASAPAARPPASARPGSTRKAPWPRPPTRHSTWASTSATAPAT
ncbi:hypothetical protein WJ972_31995 [Achromobacter insuavis]